MFAAGAPMLQSETQIRIPLGRVEAVMSLSVFSDYHWMYRVRDLNAAWQQASDSMEKLSSGLAINRASDNPAGLVISESLRSRIASLNRQADAINGTIHKYRSVSSTVSTLRTSLNELRALAVGAANEGANGDGAQAAYQTAVDSIVDTFNYIVTTAEYNGDKVLDGSDGSLADVSELSGVDLSTVEGAAASIDRIDAAINELDHVQMELGATQKHDLESHLASLRVSRDNLVAAESQVRDLDYATEYANFVSGMIRTKASMALLAHTADLGKGLIALLGS